MIIAIVKPISVRIGDLGGLKAVLHYIANKNKTQNGELVFGWNCQKDRAFQDMLLTKKMFGKTTVRQYAHFVQGFHERDNLTPELAFQIGQEYIAGLKQWSDYQILMAVHTDQDHLHIHYIINSVSSRDGSKWQFSQQNLKHFRQRSDELCQKYHLHVIENGNRGHRSYGEYKAYQQSKSWKQQLASDVTDCLEKATSRADFHHLLHECGIDVDIGKTSALFTIAAGTYGLKKEMNCGDKKLSAYGDFSAAAIEKALSTNQNIIERAFSDPGLLSDAMYEIGQMLGVSHEDLCDRFYANTLSKLEGRALKEWILKHKDRAFEANSYNAYYHSQESDNGYEM